MSGNLIQIKDDLEGMVYSKQKKRYQTKKCMPRYCHNKLPDVIE